jgi:hypothetical protein
MISIDFRPVAGGKFFCNIGKNTESGLVVPNDFEPGFPSKDFDPVHQKKAPHHFPAEKNTHD